MGEDDYSWLTDIFGGGGAPANTDPSGGSGVDVGTDPSGGSGTTGWTVNQDGTFTGPDGTAYNADGTPSAVGAPGSGANSPSGGIDWTSLLKSVGGSSGLLAALAALGGGIYSANRTNKATSQTLAGINDAKNSISSILGPGAGIGGAGIYSPYMNAGTTALGKLGGFNYQPLAPQFGNLSTGGVNALPKQLTLGTMGSK